MSWVHLVWLFLLAGSAIIYSSPDTESIVLFGNMAKVFALFVAGLTLTSTQSAYSPGDTPQKAWTCLAAGMWLWLFGQVLFAFYRVIQHQNVYPSIADIFFVIGYIPLFLGLFLLIKNFKSTGLPMGTASSYLIQGAIILIIYAAIFLKFLLPLLANDDLPGAKFLNVYYPTCDFMLIGTTSVLIRISWMMRGGSLARSWIMLGAGFTAVATADLIFAYHPALLLDIVFFTAYFLVALSGIYQLRMLKQ